MRRTLCVLVLALAALAQAQSSRQFTFRYEFSVNSVEQCKPLRIWIPLARSDQYQTVQIKSIAGDLPTRKTREAEYGNWMLYASTPKAKRSEYRFVIVYQVVRREHVGLSEAERMRSEQAGATAPALLAVAYRREMAKVRRFLEPDKLVPTSGLPAELAARQVEDRKGDLQRVRALYDYVLATMRYDKSGSGWGRGDALRACDAKRGNCTDFHSLFISMARSQGIPARFEIGFPLPADKYEGEIAGYHCWAEFYLAGKGWVPVDISEAWKDQSKREYFFGAHDANRMQFSAGRDIRLSPAQAGEPLNYFVYPYAEVGGKPHPNVSTRLSFRDEGVEIRSLRATEAAGER